MKREVILSDKAPKAIGPYSQGIRVCSLLFLSGQLPMSPETGKIVGTDIRTQTQQCLANITGILADQGLSSDDVVKATLFIKNMDDFGAINEEYAKVFIGNEPPARECVEVARLPKDALIEISVIAVFKEGN